MKIFWKIFLSILSIVIAMYVILGGTLMYASFKNSLNSERDRVLSENKLLMLTLKNTIEANMSDEESTQTYIIESVKSLEKNMGNEKFQIILYNEKNKKIYGSNRIKTAVNRERLTENKGAYVIDNVSGKHCLEAVYVIEVDSQRYYVSIVKDIEFVYEQRENMKWQYMGIFFAQLIISAVLSYFTAKRMAQPLAKLTRTTKNMAMGNYSIRADIKDGGEIGILTKNFNAMADNLEGLGLLGVAFGNIFCCKAQLVNVAHLIPFFGRAADNLHGLTFTDVHGSVAKAGYQFIGNGEHGVLVFGVSSVHHTKSTVNGGHQVVGNFGGQLLAFAFANQVEHYAHRIGNQLFI